MTAPARMHGATARLLADGRRLHLQHGPIDLVIEASGRADEVTLAYRQACEAFGPVLDDLVAELPRLRAPAGPRPEGPVARRMTDAVAPFAPVFVTPMAAVAGSVADHVLAALVEGRELDRAYVNNGGDIALHLARGTFRIGICEDPVAATAGGIVTLSPGDGIGGIATSGWRGRSHSLGIADAVTVLAETAARADAAATLIANAVDLPGSPRVTRTPASELAPDSDLGARPVTVAVAPLSLPEIDEALAGGEAAARAHERSGMIRAAFLGLAGERRTVSGNHPAWTTLSSASWRTKACA